MRVLGLDVGTKTIGVAVSDEMGWTAQGIETIKIADEQMEQSYPRLQQLIDEYSVEKIVVGLPKNMNGTIGPRGEACIEFADNVKENKITIVDENGNEQLCEILFTFDSDQYNKSYVIYYPIGADQDDEEEI